MLLLHTSDWHLGRGFHGVGLLDAQARVLDHLVEVVRAERVDVVVVAGDVYDRALPAVDTVRLLDDAIARLRGAGAQVLLTSGNHDSATRLGFGGRVMEQAGVHLRTGAADLSRPVLLHDDHGQVALYGIPYLEPALAAAAVGAAARTHEGVLSAAMTAVRADLAGRPAGTRSVVAAHAFVVGGAPSDSERDISVGGVGSVPAGVLHGVSYAALGHLHGRQQLSRTVRYSGSPLAYSFSEARQQKGSWLVRLDAAGVASVDPVAAPVPRPLAVLRGDLDVLLTDPRHTRAEQAWCHVTLTDAGRPPGAMDAVRRRFPHALVLAFDPAGARPAGQGYGERLRAAASDLDVCCAFVEHVHGGHPVSAGQSALLRRALDAARVAAEAEAPVAHEGAA